MTENFSEQALAASDSTFTPDELASATTGGFGQLITLLAEQTQVQRNEGVGRGAQISTDRYVSYAGFSALVSGATAEYTRSDIARGRQRPTEVRESDPSMVDQVVLRSFGWTVDRAALVAGSRSIRVDALDTGHNPYKVFARLQEATLQQHKGPSHLITRRGDIYSVVPWDRAPDCNTSQYAQQKSIADRAISIELEAWHTAYQVPYSRQHELDFRIKAMMPYTPAQMLALAFLLRKLAVWCGQDPTPCLGFTTQQLGALVGNGGDHRPGVIVESAFGTHAVMSPGGEWQLPPDYELGAPLPGHLTPNAAAWNERLRLHYTSKGVAQGAQISHFKTLKDAFDTLPVYDATTELFEPAGALSVYTADPGGPTANAAASAAGDATGEAYARSQRMQGSLRNQLYDAASVANEATNTALQLQAMRVNAGRTAKLSVPVIRNALAFNFATGEWTIVIGNTTLSPAPAAVSDALKAAAAAQAARGNR